MSVDRAGPDDLSVMPAAGLTFIVDNADRLRAYAATRLRRYKIPNGVLEPDEVVNYTVIELIERWDSIDDPGRYMFTVARRFVQRAAYEGRRFTGAGGPDDNGIDLDQVGSDQVSYVSTPAASPVEDQVDARIRVLRLYAAMADLTPQQRRAVWLVDLAGRSRADAAAAMNVAVGAVSVHRDRGLKKLRMRLSEFGGCLAAIAWAGLALVVRWCTSGERSVPPLPPPYPGESPHVVVWISPLASEVFALILCAIALLAWSTLPPGRQERGDVEGIADRSAPPVVAGRNGARVPGSGPISDPQPGRPVAPTFTPSGARAEPRPAVPGDAASPPTGSPPTGIRPTGEHGELHSLE